MLKIKIDVSFIFIVVYMTTDISSEGLMRVYEALGRKADGEKVTNYFGNGEHIFAFVSGILVDILQ